MLRVGRERYHLRALYARVPEGVPPFERIVRYMGDTVAEGLCA